jgi:hypothetical protein
MKIVASAISSMFFPFVFGGFYPFLKLRQAGAGPAEQAAHAAHGHKRLAWALVVAFMLRTPLLFAFAAWLLHGLTASLRCLYIRFIHSRKDVVKRKVVKLKKPARTAG